MILLFSYKKTHGAVKNALAVEAPIFLDSYRSDLSEDITRRIFLADKFEGSG